MQSITIGLSFALYVVWMQRQHRWALTFKALTGELVLSGTRGTSSQVSSANAADISSAIGTIANPAPTPQKPILPGVLSPGTNIGGGGGSVVGNQGVSAIANPAPGPSPAPLGGFLQPGSSIG